MLFYRLYHRHTKGNVGYKNTVHNIKMKHIYTCFFKEFRTTVVDELHEAEDFHAIGKWIAGANAYYLQGFVDSGSILADGMSAASESKMANCLAIAGRYISNTQIRGL